MVSTQSSNMKIPLLNFEDTMGRFKNNYFPESFPTPVWGVNMSGINTYNEQLPCLGTTDQAGIVRRRTQKTVSGESVAHVNHISSRLGQTRLSYNPRITDNQKVLRQPSNFNANMPSRLGQT